MYFTLAVSAATPDLCAALADRARIADPAVMPIPGPAVIAWRSPDGRAALLHWGQLRSARDEAVQAVQAGEPRDEGPAGSHAGTESHAGTASHAGTGSHAGTASHAGTIWTGTPTPGSGRAPVFARTSITRVDPVYVAEVPGAVIVADRASWAASTASRLDSHDPLHICALLNPGFPLGTVTPFTGVSALTSSTTLHLLHGELTRIPTPVGGQDTLSPVGAPRTRPSVQLSAPFPASSPVPTPAPPPATAANRATTIDNRATAATATTAAEPTTTTTAEPSATTTTRTSTESATSAANVGLSGLGLASGAPDHDAPPDSVRVNRPRDAGHPGGARAVAEALVAAVAHLGDAGRPVELSLTGGKDSRLVVAAFVAAGVPVVARTHGFADHPDVVVAAEIARRLGIEHIVRTPAAPGQQVDVLGRIRATVLVADGMLSAFENVGRPDPAASVVVTAGGHGGELLRGGYAETAVGRPAAVGGLRAALGPARRAARSAELLRRLTTKHLGLLRRGPAAGYVASLTPWTVALTRGPLAALDDFYLVNRAGRWSAAARQAYLIRENLVQPLFDEHVVAAARAVPLADRVSGALSAAVLAELCPALTDIPLAGKPPTAKAQPPAGAAMSAAPASFDWRRQYGETIASFLHDYTLDLGATAGLFDIVSRPAAEKLLAPPHTDRATVWALATLACLLSGDYRRARDASPHLTVT
jgi:hypothetical protein